MYEYVLTAFDRSGKLLTSEQFRAEHDSDAKQLVYKILVEKTLLEHTYRLTRSGKLLLFNS